MDRVASSGFDYRFRGSYAPKILVPILIGGVQSGARAFIYRCSSGEELVANARLYVEKWSSVRGR